MPDNVRFRRLKSEQCDRAAECLRKAASLRLMARMLDPGVTQDRALRLAEMWEQKARQVTGGDEKRFDLVARARFRVPAYDQSGNDGQ